MAKQSLMTISPEEDFLSALVPEPALSLSKCGNAFFA
jgi:hypothetical protein